MLFIKVRFWLRVGGGFLADWFFLEDPDSCVADMLIAMESRTTRLVFLASSSNINKSSH